MSVITGSPVYPASIVIPDDGDARTASSVGVPFEALADRTAWLHAALAAHGATEVVFNASGSLTVPDQCRLIVAVGYGGGGAGGAGGTAGSGGAAPYNTLLPGGGGGGGAPELVHVFAVTPGETLSITVGAGQNASIPVATQGAPSKVERGGDVLAYFPGGAGGSWANIGNTIQWGEHYPFVSGGTSTPYVSSPSFAQQHGVIVPVFFDGTFDEGTFVSPLPPPLPAGHGGYGTCEAISYRAIQAGQGTASHRGIAGGASGGVRGVDSVLSRGGGAGGGGGAGPGGIGGAGGAGGAASAVNASGSPGGAGVSAAANTGAGGGGGGSGGQGTDASRGSGGAGGNGGSGRVVLYALKVGAP